ncbi:hypothetical protein MRX96_005235 [Rhipicephalus microplus]
MVTHLSFAGSIRLPLWGKRGRPRCMAESATGRQHRMETRKQARAPTRSSSSPAANNESNNLLSRACTEEAPIGSEPDHICRRPAKRKHRRRNRSFWPTERLRGGEVEIENGKAARLPRL